MRPALREKHYATMPEKHRQNKTHAPGTWPWEMHAVHQDFGATRLDSCEADCSCITARLASSCNSLCCMAEFKRAFLRDPPCKEGSHTPNPPRTSDFRPKGAACLPIMLCRFPEAGLMWEGLGRVTKGSRERANGNERVVPSGLDGGWSNSTRKRRTERCPNAGAHRTSMLMQCRCLSLICSRFGRFGMVGRCRLLHETMETLALTIGTWQGANSVPAVCSVILQLGWEIVQGVFDLLSRALVSMLRSIPSRWTAGRIGIALAKQQGNNTNRRSRPSAAASSIAACVDVSVPRSFALWHLAVCRLRSRKVYEEYKAGSCCARLRMLGVTRAARGWASPLCKDSPEKKKKALEKPAAGNLLREHGRI